MNADGHLRSVFFGRSETMVIKDSVIDGGEYHIWLNRRIFVCVRCNAPFSHFLLSIVFSLALILTPIDR